MSPRAAWRLEHLGFERVHDYTGGKMDWLAFDLPHEGTATLVGDAVDRDVPTCGLAEPLGDVAERMDERPCVVLNEHDIVMGVVPPGTTGADATATVESVMDIWVTTVRPSEDLPGLLERMRHRDVERMVVTRSDGVLVGLLEREARQPVAEGDARVAGSEPTTTPDNEEG